MIFSNDIISRFSAELNNEFSIEDVNSIYYLIKQIDDDILLKRYGVQEIGNAQVCLLKEIIQEFDKDYPDNKVTSVKYFVLEERLREKIQELCVR